MRTYGNLKMMSLASLGWEILNQSLYSPDLAPSDLSLVWANEGASWRREIQDT
jgi:hypothetical protein